MSLTTNKTALQELIKHVDSINTIEYQSKTVTPRATEQIVVADSGYDGLSSVIVEGDANLVPSNIPIGIEILGITGTRPHNTESCMIAISSNVSSGSVTATNGTDTATGTIANGECILQVPSDGVWTINGSISGHPGAEATSELKASDNVNLIFFEAIVGCYIMNDASATVTCTNGTTTYTSTGTGAHYFTVYERGTWTVSCTIDGVTWSYSPTVQTHQARYIDVFDGEVDAVLNNNTWALISTMSKAGVSQNLWAVGDTKEITINGTVGKTPFSNLSIWAFILGFNHNPTYEGENSIHFQIGKSAQTYGTNLCLIDSKHETHVSNTAGYFNMNYSSSNSGGWASSKMRTVLLGSQYDPNSPLSGSLLAALDADLRGAMKACTKYSDNTGGGSDTASYVTATTDYLWLLSEWEVQGARSRANSAEQNYQQRYDYYANGNSRVFYQHSANTSTARWWLRSTYTTGSNSFCCIKTNGNMDVVSAAVSTGSAPAFCV